MGPASTGLDDEGLSIEGTPPVYLHVGKMNFSTWYFGVLRLYPSAMQHSSHSRVLLLEPGLVVHEHQDTFSDVEAFKQLLNFDGVVKMSILTVSFQDEDWPSPLVIEDPSLPVAKLKEQSEIIVWLSSQQEEERRKKNTKQPSTSARRTRRGRGPGSAGRGRGTGGRGRGRGRKRKREEVEEQQALLDEDTDDGTFKLESIEDLINQNHDGLSDSQNEDEELLQMLVGPYDNIDSDGDHSGHSDHDSISSNMHKDPDKDDQKSESEAKVPDISDSDWDSETGDIAGETAGPSDAVSVGNLVHNPDEPPVAPAVESVEIEAGRIGDDAVVTVPRAPASTHERIPGFRDLYSREIFDIPNLGQLRYYPQHQHITALCALRTCEHDRIVECSALLPLKGAVLQEDPLAF